MIVSHTHRFVFIKPRKTAGTSLEVALSASLVSGDFATSIEADEEFLRPVNPGVNIGPIRYRAGLLKRRLRDHSPLTQAVDCFGEEILDYRIVTMSRNPWARAVSQFYWSNRRTNIRTLEFAERRELFNAYTRKWGPVTWLDKVYGRKRQRSLNASNLYHFRGKPLAKFAVRFESIDEDLQDLCAWLEIGSLTMPTKKLKSGLRGTGVKRWQDYFETDVIELVRRECAYEIEAFGYTFEREAPSKGSRL